MLQDNPSVLPDSIPTRSQELEMLKSLPFDEFLDRVVKSMVSFTINLVIAVLVFFVGRFLIRRIHNIIFAILVKRNVDTSLTTFIISLVDILLYFILIVSVVGILGIETSSFVAIFASAGVALGMAMSGTLQNFAGGVLILFLKPYKVGDFIEAGGFSGTVKEIQIFNTVLTTPDNKSIIIPNGGLSTGSINNYSKENFRRIEWIIAISYGDDVDVARREILNMLLADDRVVKDKVAPALSESPEESRKSIIEKLKQKSDASDLIEAIVPSPTSKPAVYVKELGDNSVNLSVRAWTKNADYWNVFFEMNEKFYKELPKYGINFPFPQLDVHLHEQES